MKQHILLLIFFQFAHFLTHAQTNFVVVGNTFGIPTINSAACSEVDTCFTLTQDLTFQAGAVWDLNPIDLSKKFDALFCLTLGSNDANGADGFAFILRSPSSLSIGQSGGGLGYVTIQPSLAIEFDTWDNGTPYDDLAVDHTGMYANGDFANPLVSATPLTPGSGNVEDGNYHTTRIVWNPDQDSLKMYFDGILRLSYHGDIRNTIFNGLDHVIWGFTASTGGSTNLQQICFPYRSIHLQDTMICQGDSVAVSYYTDNITMYNWSTPLGDTIVDWNANSGTSFNLDDTLFYASESNDYILNIEFNNMFYTDTATVTVVPLPIKPFDQPHIEYCPDLSQLILDAQNPGCRYEWFPTGDTTQTLTIIGDLQHQGLYEVTITEPVNQCTNRDSILITMFCSPIIEVPNIFTPNGDGSNDVFTLILKTSEVWVSNLKFEVINRWGNTVYTSDTVPSWDGTSNNQEMAEGIYFYKLSYTDIRTQEIYEAQGNITLIR